MYIYSNLLFGDIESFCDCINDAFIRLMQQKPINICWRDISCFNCIFKRERHSP